MLKYSIEKTALKERILSVYFGDDIYVGLGSKFINYSKGKILCIHEKSVRNISGNENFIGCCSYDETATVFDRNGILIDKIEGPSTEIKGIAFHENFISLTTRGKTTWILENLEISKILEDHTQDVKGCKFYEDDLYTWSYDNSLKMYQLFSLDHSWELMQSIEFEDIVWAVLFFKGLLCATLQNGKLVVFEKIDHQWIKTTEMKISLSPVYCGAVMGEYLGVVCNRNVLMILDSNFKKIAEIPDLNEGCDVFAISYNSVLNELVCGSEDGTLAIVNLTLE